MAQILQRENGKWLARVRRTGWPGQTKTFLIKVDAEKWARSVEREMDTDSFITRDDAERTTFAKAIERYERDVLPSKRGKAKDAYRLRSLASVFGQYSLASITPARLSEYRDTRLKAVKAQTVIHELGLISRIYQAASLDWGIALPKGNPVASVRKPALQNDRSRRLEGDEEKLLFDAMEACQSSFPRAATILAIETAARQSELLAMDWSDVNLKSRTVRMRGKDGGVTKNGEAYRDVPLSPRAIECLKALCPATKGRVLPISQNALKIAWRRTITRARKARIHALLCLALEQHGFDKEAQDREIRAVVYKKRQPTSTTIELLVKLNTEDKILVDLHFHDLRHEATSRLAEKLQMHELMKVTGHKSSRMLSRYYHPRAEDLAKKLG